MDWLRIQMVEAGLVNAAQGTVRALRQITSILRNGVLIGEAESIIPTIIFDKLTYILVRSFSELPYQFLNFAGKTV